MKPRVRLEGKSADSSVRAEMNSRPAAATTKLLRKLLAQVSFGNSSKLLLGARPRKTIGTFCMLVAYAWCSLIAAGRGFRAQRGDAVPGWQQSARSLVCSCCGVLAQKALFSPPCLFFFFKILHEVLNTFHSSKGRWHALAIL